MTAETFHERLLRLGNAKDYAGVIETLRTPFPAERGDGVCQGSEADTAQGNPATDALIPPGFVVAPREAAAWLIEFVDESGCLAFTEEDADEIIADALPGATKEPLYRLLAALPPPGGGKGSSSTYPAARIASDHAATAPQSQSEGEG